MTKRDTPSILVLSLSQVARFIAGPDDVCISIRSPGAEPAPMSPNFRDVLRLYFHDLAPREPPWPDGSVQLGEEDARAIAEFVERHRDAHRMVVHCEAGISRSVAVALAISSAAFGYWAWPGWYADEDREQRWVHNRWVFELVCAAIRASAPDESALSTPHHISTYPHGDPTD